MTDYKSLSDEKLQLLAVNGSREAENFLSERYLRLVKSCARKYILVGGDAEDLVQEGTLGLISAIRTYDVKRNVPFGAYARHCITMRIISAVNSAGSRKNSALNDGVSIENLAVEPVESVDSEANSQPSPEEILLKREHDEELIIELFASLSFYESKVIALYLRGFTISEIASRTGKNARSVQNAIQRAKEKVAKNYQGDISIS